MRVCAWLLVAACGLSACAAKKPTNLVKPAVVKTKAPPAAPVPAAPVPAAAPAPPSSTAPATSAAAAPRPPAPAPLVGHVTRADLEAYVTWKELRAQDFTPDPTAVKTIAERAAGIEVLAIVATWCGDSKREVPRFFKIADQAKLPLERVTLVAVDRSKKDADGLAEKHGVTRVPTFVFFRDGREIGRFTEKSTTTIDNDIATILSK
jgi:thiol-disulfide isomerase/thioredoxin